MQPYIEVKVTDPENEDEKQRVRVKRTATSDGQCPEFNQILDFVLEARNKACFTRDELADSKVMITITLFDEYTVSERIGNRTTTYHENIYLG